MIFSSSEFSVASILSYLKIGCLHQATGTEFLVSSTNSAENTTKSPNGSGNISSGLSCSEQRTLTNWIIDFGATNHMIFDLKDFMEFS